MRLENGGNVDARHHHARLRLDAHQPLLLEQLQRLADRGLADLTGFGQLAPRDSVVSGGSASVMMRMRRS